MRLSKQPALFYSLAKHWRAIVYVFSVVIPTILRTGRKPVIFSRWSGMGDIICTIPAALELKKRHSGAPCIYNCDPDFALVPQMTGVADACTHCREIGSVGYWYSFLLGGFYHFAHRDDSHDSIAMKPMYQEFCEQFGLPPAESHPALPIDDLALSRARRRLAELGVQHENLILIHCGPTWPVKEWPMEHWKQLADELFNRGYTNLVQIGLGQYMPSQRTQPIHASGASVNLGNAAVTAIPIAKSLVGALSLEESIAIISMARLIIGIDSGLLHIAACTGTPAVGIFGATLPENFYRPEIRKHFVVADVKCIGCHHRLPREHWITGCPYHIECMNTLQAKNVLAACLAILAGQPPPSFATTANSHRSAQGTTTLR